MLYTLETFGGNYSGFLRLRERRVNKIPFLTEEIKSTLLLKEQGGYDGQWYYYISYDPLLARFADHPEIYDDIIDAPPYRYTRIGFPALTRVFSGGDPYAFPKIMILLILAFNVIGAVFFMKIVTFYKRKPYWGFLYALIPATTACLNLGVPESIAMAFVVGGLYWYLKERFSLALLFLACAILVRETSVLLVVLMGGFEWLKHRNLRRGVLMLAAILPLVVWKLFLTWRLFPLYGWQTFHYSPGDFTVPFKALYDLYVTNWNTSLTITGLLIYPLFIIVNLVLSFFLLRSRRDLFALALIGYSFLHLSLNYHKIWGHIRDLERTMSDGLLFVMLSFLAGSAQMHWALKYCILAVFAGLFLYKAVASPMAADFVAGFDLLR